MRTERNIGMIDAAIQKKQVLLVDDDNNVSQMLKLLLETQPVI